MTTMTPAEYKHGEYLAQIAEQVGDDVVPGGAAEDYVIDLEHEHDATEDDPLVIEDPHERAHDLGSDVRDDAEEMARCHGAGQVDAEAVAEGFYEDAYGAVLEEFDRAPTIDVEGEL
jgi:hypothetical protein